MKFLSIAVLALAGLSSNGAEAKKRGGLNGAEMKRRMKNGLVNKQTLMKGAKPYGKNTIRKLENQEFAITGDYSIQFDSCISLTVQNEDFAEDGNLALMASNGELISEKDYIMFKVCQTEYCSYYEDDDKLTFITDVGTYFNALSQYLPSKIEDYCGACEEQYNYCYAEYSGQTYYPEGYEEQQQQEDNGEEQQQENGEEQNQDNNGEDQNQDNNGGRKLEQTTYVNADGQTVRFIDCEVCKDYECLDFYQNSNGYYNENGEYVEMEAGSQGFYDEDGEFIEYGLDDATEWLNGFAECSETTSYLDNYLLYAGLMCNADGDGIEIGLFVDDQCLLYTPTVAYKDVMLTSDQAYYSMISDVVEFTFTNDFECYNPEFQYTNKVDYSYEQQQAAQNGENQNQNQNNDANEEAAEAAEWCQNLVGGGQAYDMYDCGGYENNGNADYGDDDYATYNTWYNYELYQQQAEDLQEVCAIVNNYDGEFHTIYNNKNPGLFNYKKGKNSSSGAAGLSGGAIAAIVVVVLAVAGGAAAMMMKKSGPSDKKKPLINEEGGTLA